MQHAVFFHGFKNNLKDVAEKKKLKKKRFEE